MKSILFLSKPLKLFKYLLLICIALVLGCDSEIEEGVMKSDLNKDVEMVTNYGTIIMRLSDETPKHRNNFIKLVNQKFYDSLLFHRVIENFIIQTGDPESKNPNSDKVFGASDLPYRIPKEINNNLFHKRGALNAAREGDNSNPDQASSSTQFTIVQGRVYNDSTLNIAEHRVNEWLAYNKVIHKPENKIQFEELQTIVKNRDSTKIDIYNQIKSEFDSLSKLEEATMEKYQYPEAHREIYKTIGGAAHLDQNYTVFGEVVKGMNVVDSIAAVEKKGSRPIKDVRIISARMVSRKNY